MKSIKGTGQTAKYRTKRVLEKACRDLVREYGLRPIVNALADVLEDADERNLRVTLNDPSDKHDSLNRGELQTAVSNLRNGYLF